MAAQIHLSTEQEQMLTRLAAQSGKSWEEVFSEALASFEQRARRGNGTPVETVQAAMVRLGLLGCVKDAPADLSTNPTYMEGFGSRGG